MACVSCMAEVLVVGVTKGVGSVIDLSGGEQSLSSGTLNSKQP